MQLISRLRIVLLFSALLLGDVSAESTGQSLWSDVFKASKNKVVQIFSYPRQHNWFEPYRQGAVGQSRGSGFFVKIDGKISILTNYHVIEGSDLIVIQHPALGREQFEVKFDGGCPALDCVRLSFNDEEYERITKLLGVDELEYFELASSDNLPEGQEVMIMGYPLGQENVKNATGIISGRESIAYGEWMTTTVPANPGNSGGPFLNKEGKVIGMCVAGACDSQGRSAQGVDYLIPITNACLMLDQFVNGAIIRTPFWGIRVSSMTHATLSYLGAPDTGGAYVTEVLEKSLGESLGLKKGDIITHIDCYEVDRFCQVTVPWTEYRVSLFDALTRFRAGDTAVFSVLRDGERLDLSTTVLYDQPFAVKVCFPPFEQVPGHEIFGGMVIAQITKNHIIEIMNAGATSPIVFDYLKHEKCYEPYLGVTYVMPGSELDKVNIFSDVSNRLIAKVNNQEVKTIDDFRKAVLDHATDEYVTFECQGGALFALKLSDILRKEKVFARQKGYELTDFYHELVKRRKNR